MPSKSTKSIMNPAAGVAQAILDTYRDQVLPFAVKMTAPAPVRVPLANAKLTKPLIELVKAYLPR